MAEQHDNIEKVFIREDVADPTPSFIDNGDQVVGEIKQSSG